MIKEAVRDGEPKVLLLIPQQDKISGAVQLLGDKGILHFVYTTDEEVKGIVVGINDVERAQAWILKKGIGVSNDTKRETVGFKVEPMYGILDIAKTVAHRLTCYGIPSWVLNDFCVCVRKDDEGRARKLLDDFRLNYE